MPAKLVPRRDLEIGGVPCMAEREVHISRTGEVEYATLARGYRSGDLECRAGTLLVRGADGSVRRFTPERDVVIEGFCWRGGEEITLPDEHFDILWGVLAEPTSIGGIPCAAARTHLDEHRSVRQATLAADFVLDGVALPGGTWFEWMFGGLYAVELSVAMTIRGRALEAGTRYVL